MKILNATDLGGVRGRRGEGLNLDRFPAPVYHGANWIYLEGRESWEMTSHALAFAGLAPCPVCHGARLKKSHYCTGCDRTGLDGRVEFPGLEIDAAPDPDYPGIGTKFDPDPELAGGIEKPAKLRRGISRNRRKVG